MLLHFARSEGLQLGKCDGDSRDKTEKNASLPFWHGGFLKIEINPKEFAFIISCFLP